MKSNSESADAVAAKELEARELVLRAAGLLKSLGPDRERIGWMLEDSLIYLDELCEEAVELPQVDALAWDMPRASAPAAKRRAAASKRRAAGAEDSF